jgi:hypothetical protein
VGGGGGAGWTRLPDVRARLRRSWDSGRYLSAWAGGAPFERISVPLRGPGARQLGEQFDEVRAWSQEWFSAASSSSDFRLETRAAGGRSIGTNELPARFVVDGGWEALWRVLGVGADVARFRALRALTARAVPTDPALLAWVIAHPMTVLRHEPDEWARVLATARWLVAERGRGHYLRQVPVPGVDTKFIETHRALLADLLDVLLPAGTVPADVPRSRFADRYGFRSQPTSVRFRPLGWALPALPGVSELGVRVDDFAAAAPDVATVFILENEITYLAFPDVPNAIAVFGGGYAVAALAASPWFAAAGRRVHYWGDLDTHGFAILDQVRARVPAAESFLMDSETLLAHAEHWGREPSQHPGPLTRLTGPEAALHQELLDGAHGPAVRLEQERIAFPYLERAVQNVLATAGPATAGRGRL